MNSEEYTLIQQLEMALHIFCRCHIIPLGNIPPILHELNEIGPERLAEIAESVQTDFDKSQDPPVRLT